MKDAYDKVIEAFNLIIEGIRWLEACPLPDGSAYFETAANDPFYNQAIEIAQNAILETKDEVAIQVLEDLHKGEYDERETYEYLRFWWMNLADRDA